MAPERGNIEPYTGQVQLGGPDNSILQIYLENAWRPVCSSNLSQHAADTACRQLGYTGAPNPYPQVFPGYVLMYRIEF